MDTTIDVCMYACVMERDIVTTEVYTQNEH